MGSPNALSSITESLWPLDKTIGYSDVSVTTTSSMPEEIKTDVAIERSAPIPKRDSGSSNGNGIVTLTFKQEFTNGPPDVMHLMYAIGMSAQLGIHISRSCFDVLEFPTCPSTTTTTTGGSNNKLTGGDDIPPRTNEANTNAASSSSSAVHSSLSSISSVMMNVVMTVA